MIREKIINIKPGNYHFVDNFLYKTLRAPSAFSCGPNLYKKHYPGVALKSNYNSDEGYQIIINKSTNSELIKSLTKLATQEFEKNLSGELLD